MDAVFVAAHVILSCAVEEGDAVALPETGAAHVGQLQVIAYAELEAAKFVDCAKVQTYVELLVGCIAKVVVRLLLKTDIHVCPVNVEEYFEVVPEAMLAREEPSGDSSYIPLFLAAREAAKHTDACCSGEGPDELFCGYKVYQNYLNAPQDDYWKAAHTCMKTRGLRKPQRYLKQFADGFEKMQAFDLTYATECNLLPNLDAVARANKIDIRTPLIDRRLFDFAVSIPVEYKVTPDNNKIVFRDAAETFLPQEVAQKPKRAFPVPTQVWMHEEPWASMIKETFASREAKYLLGGPLPRYYIRKYFSETASREATSSYWHPVWTMYALLVWYRGEFGRM